MNQQLPTMTTSQPTLVESFTRSVSVGLVTGFLVLLSTPLS